MTDKLTIAEIAYMIEKIHEAARAKQWNKIDYWLSKDVTGISEDEMIALMRGTYPMRKHLRKWENFTIRSYHELKNRGSDADYICDGLLSGLDLKSVL